MIIVTYMCTLVESEKPSKVVKMDCIKYCEVAIVDADDC